VPDPTSASRRVPSPGPYQALAIDIDGTLIDRSLEITPRNLAALQGAIGRGIRVILATGRMYRSALRYAQEIGTEEPLICYQGGVVRAFGGEILRQWPVPPEDAVAALKLSRELKLHINLYRDDVFYVEEMGWGGRRYAEVSQMEPQIVPDLMELARQGSTKVVFVDQPERLRELEPVLRARLEPRARLTFSVPEFLEMVDPGVSKGAALAYVCERIGLDRAHLLAAGDAPNDVEMFRYAGFAVAPANAFPEALAEADAIIPPPGDDGIAEMVGRYLG
jgi:Cof subfamily protein (haloacid dehalogenase superfamily)